MISEKKITEGIQKVIAKLYDLSEEELNISLQITKKEFKGNLTLVTFPFTKALRKKPEEIAEEIGSELKSSGYVKDYNVVKGFLNLELLNSAWTEFLKEGQDANWPKFEKTGELFLVEYSSPNTNKPLHLGHLRNNFLGWSVSELLKIVGNDVKKVQIINDRGIHICKSMLAWQKYGNGETPESAGIKGDKLVGNYYVKFDQEYKKEIASLVEKGRDQKQAEKEAPIIQEAQAMLLKWEDGDKELTDLWKRMNQWVYTGFDETYKTIGVDFDKLYYESNTYLKGKEIVLKGLETGAFYKKEDGSVWVDLSEQGLDEKLLLRADGTSVYMTQDIGTAILRYEEFSSLNGLVYTVGNEQEYHFKVLFLILEKLGYEWAKKCYHLSYGMVDLPSGKMKSREGTVVDADDLVEEMVNTAERHTRELGKIDDFEVEEAKNLYKDLGLGALKFFLLKVDPSRRMLFDPEESIQFQGHTGPFIQYTHARICALIRRANTEGLKIDSVNIDDVEMSDLEMEVLFQVSLFEDKLLEAAKTYDPSVISTYIFELAKEFNRFYADSPIFNEEDENLKAFRISLSSIVAKTIHKSMGLLGINSPEKM